MPRNGREETSRRPGTGAVETARYTALAMDLWKTFDWISSEADSPGSSFDNATASQAIESDLTDARNLIANLDAIKIRGRRFGLACDVEAAERPGGPDLPAFGSLGLHEARHSYGSMLI